MPIYEYECRSCTHNFEALVRSQREHEVRCPDCGGAELRRLMSVFGFTGAGIRSSASHDTSGCDGCAAGNCASCNCSHHH